MAARSEQFALPTVERRAAERRNLRIAARLELVGGIRNVTIANLSVAGACLETDTPPAVGAPARLSWDGQQHYCQVVWVSDQRCGVEFEATLHEALVDAASQAPTPSGPVASLLNIRVGRKRSRVIAQDALSSSDPASVRWQWTVALHHPRIRGHAGNDKAWAADEEMFFFGSPLAHLIARSDQC